mgnify:FL=1
MTQFKKCPLCKSQSFFCERCHNCYFEGYNKYYTNQHEYDVLFSILNKKFPQNMKYFDLDQTILLDIYIQYEKHINHEIMMIDEKFKILINVIKSFIRSRSKISWLKWKDKVDNIQHNNSVLELHVGNIPGIPRGYLPIDCCRIIYSYLHKPIKKK